MYLVNNNDLLNLTTAPSTFEMPVSRTAGRRLPWAVVFFLTYIGAITVIGKGPSYLGIFPLFWGEAVLITSIMWLIYKRGLVRAAAARLDLMTLAVVSFMGLGFIRLLFSLSEDFSLDAIRDSATWYYGCFFFVGSYIAQNEEMAEKVWRVLVRLWMGALVWGTMDVASGFQLSTLGPKTFRGEAIISNSMHELVQHMLLACLIVFNPRLHRGVLKGGIYVLVPISFVSMFLIATFRGRGAKTGFIVGLLIMIVLRFAPGSPMKISRQVISVLLVGILAGGVGFLTMGQSFLRYTQIDRYLEADPNALSGTAHWRMIWWQILANEVNTRNPYFGLGFGESLSVYHPKLHGDEHERWPVRSPHNVNVTIFTRMGWVGAGLWVFVLIALLGRLWLSAWRGHWRGQKYEPARRDEIAFWIVLVLATWGNASVGVLMEGPVLGVWFWFAAGFSVGRTVLPKMKRPLLLETCVSWRDPLHT